jgi:UDP-glucose 4-epimerase
MKTIVLVTGTSGRIGEAIAEILLAANYSVIGVDKIPGKLTTNICDTGNVSQIRKLLVGAKGIVHTAAYHAPHVGKVSDDEFIRTNVSATRILGELAVEMGVQRFIFTSTTALYGYASQLGDQAAWIDETTLPQPKTIYHTTKIEAEEALKTLTQSTNLKVTVIRMSRCFPEPADIMACYRLHRGVDRRDVALAHKLALENQGLPPFDLFVVSGKTPFHRDDRFEMFCNAQNLLQARCPELLRLLKEIGAAPPQSIDRVYDSSKAIRILGWQPVYGYSEVFKQLKDGSSEVMAPIGTLHRLQNWQAE